MKSVNFKVQEMKRRHLRRPTSMADSINTRRRMGFFELEEEEEDEEADRPNVVIETLDQFTQIYCS
jgi:hypothetical protein